MAKQMTNTQLIDTFNDWCRAWLDDEAADTMVLGGVEFELSYGNDGMMRVFCEGVEVAKTDCRRDFMRMGTYLLETAK